MLADEQVGRLVLASEEALRQRATDVVEIVWAMACAEVPVALKIAPSSNRHVEQGKNRRLLRLSGLTDPAPELLPQALCFPVDVCMLLEARPARLQRPPTDSELTHDRHASRAQVRREVFEYIEVFYNPPGMAEPPAAATFVSGLPLPGGLREAGRGESCLTRCPLFRGQITLLMGTLGQTRNSTLSARYGSRAGTGAAERKLPMAASMKSARKPAKMNNSVRPSCSGLPSAGMMSR